MLKIKRGVHQLDLLLFLLNHAKTIKPNQSYEKLFCTAKLIIFFNLTIEISIFFLN
jgi:hypothetical protein